jgi:hypothetical protein
MCLFKKSTFIDFLNFSRSILLFVYCNHKCFSFHFFFKAASLVAMIDHRIQILIFILKHLNSLD